MSGKNAAADRLEQMRQKMAKHKSGGGSTEYWKPEEGDSTFRILPQVGNMDFWWQEVGKHAIGSGKEEKTVLCPNFTTDGELPCPFCELAQQAYDEGDKKLSSLLRTRRYYHMNVLVREMDKESEGYRWAGPFVYTPGIQVFEALTGIIQDPEYGDITDAVEGFNLKIKREGKKLDTKYSILPARQPSPLADTAEGVAEILGSVKDLSTIKDHLPSYEELQKELTSPEYESSEDPEEERF